MICIHCYCRFFLRGFVFIVIVDFLELNAFLFWGKKKKKKPGKLLLDKPFLELNPFLFKGKKNSYTYIDVKSCHII